MRKIVGFVGAGSLVLLAAFGCSGSGSAQVATSNDTSSADGFITAYCDQFMPCCTRVGLTGNDALCRAFVTAFAPAYSYNAAAGDACLSEIRAAAGSPTFCEMKSTNAPSCRHVFSTTGTSLPGTPCQKTEECAPSTEGKVSCASVYKNGAEIRKCQVELEGSAGDGPCIGTVDGNITSYTSNTSDVIPRGYLCDVENGIMCDSASQKCTALAQVGAPCSSSSGCVKTAYCDFSSHACAQRKAAGTNCTGASGQCEAGAYCDTTQKLCVLLVPDGGACTVSNACASSRCVNGTCAKGSLSLSLLCGPS
jgi:hypothetical protein